MAQLFGPLSPKRAPVSKLLFYSSIELHCRWCQLRSHEAMIQHHRGRIVNVSRKAALTQWTRCLALGTQAHGIAVFAFAPGLVRTFGSEYLFTSPDVPQELADIFRGRFSRGEDTPIECAAQMLLFLVSGSADALSGRCIRVQDKEEELVQRAEEIQREDLHILTLRT